MSARTSAREEMIGGGISRSHFLADDTADVVLSCIPRKAMNPNSQKHEFFSELLRPLWASFTLPDQTPVVNLLGSADNVEAIGVDCERQKVKPIDRMTFRVESSFPIDQDFWHVIGGANSDSPHCCERSEGGDTASPVFRHGCDGGASQNTPSD